MKNVSLVAMLLALTLTACEGWVIRPAPYEIPTPFFTRTPSIYSPTPIILAPPITATETLAGPTATLSLSPTVTDTPVISTITLSPTAIPTLSVQINSNVLGCNTSIDITHGMGEVTNAYVTIQNLGTSDLDNVCVTLNALDEGRPHPDKTKCVPSLPAKYEVTQKLTVDTTYKKDTPIQLDVTSNDQLLQRVGQDSCTDIGLFPPGIDDLGAVKPIP